MPTYDYKCSECGHTFEESLKIADRDAPTELPCEQQIQQTKHMFIKCGGKVEQVMQAPYFGYDNIRTRHSSKKVPDWYNDKVKDIKRNHPGGNL